MKRFINVFFLAFSLGFAGAPLTSVAKSPEPPFPESLRLEQRAESLSKRGEYRYVYRMFFKLYDAALYTSTSASKQQLLTAETDFRLQFRYLRKIDKSIILESSKKMLEKNLSSQELDQIQERVERLNDAYRTVEKGDRSSLTYIEGEGTTLKINGKPIITIEGQDFAAFYFRIWLGEQAISTSLRDHLLGIKG